MCGYLYMQINYTHYTHIYYVKTNFYFGCDWSRLIVAHPYIRIISEGSCDTEDRSNDAVIPALLSQEYNNFFFK